MPDPRKILLLQLYSNGDCLYATAVARQIKQDFPGCHLTWGIASFCKHIIAHNPYVDEVWPIDGVIKSDVVVFRRLRKDILKQKKQGKWDEVFFIHNQERNQALYDGTIRGMILRAYPSPITVPLQPVLVLSEEEKNNVRLFAEKHSLRDFKNVILWEYAPQSGQLKLSLDFVRQVAERITAESGTCILLSSANSFEGTPKIIDASSLSVRENAALTHYCTLLIGCSSGITWISTSSAGKQLPMLQLLDPQATFRNAPSVDFKRYGIDDSGLVELMSFDEEKIRRVVSAIIDRGIGEARREFNEELPVQFKTTRLIVYNLLCYLQFGSIARHYKITTSLYGRHPLFLKEFFLGFLTAPFKLVANKWRKR